MMNFKRFQWFAAGLCGAALVLALSGCETGNSSDSRFADVPGLTTPGNIAGATTGAPGQPTTGIGIASDPTYQFKPGNSVTITITDTPMILPAINDTIKEDGTITLIYNKTFQLAGKTRRAVEKEIRDAYVPSVFTAMTVQVAPKESTRFYYVGGEVKTPGRELYITRITVLGAIRSAGDFTDYASKRKVRLTRAASGTSIIIDCKKALKDPTLDVEVFPDDKIYVPRSLF